MPPLRIVVADRPPMISVAHSPDGTHILSGYLAELLPTLLEHAGVNSTWAIKENKIGGGNLQPGGHWSGVMGDLTEGRADLALFPLALTSQRDKVISHTAALMNDGFGIVVPQQQVGGGYSSFLMPFDTNLWILLLVTLVFTSLMLFVVDHFSRKARLRAFGQMYGLARLQQRRQRDRLLDHAMANTMMSVGNGEAPRTHSISIKVWAVAWGFFCVIILNSYTANLTANLTARRLSGTISSLTDLAASGGLFGVPADSSMVNFFESSSDPNARQLHPRMIEYSSFTDAAQAVRDGHLVAFVCAYPDAVHMTQVPPCDLALAPQNIGSTQYVLGMPLNSTLRPKLDAALLALNEAGYLAALRRRWFVETSQCQGGGSAAGDAKEGKTRLGLGDLWSVFLIPAAGLLLTLLVLLAEVLYYRKAYKGVCELSSDVSKVGPLRAFSSRLQRQRTLSGSILTCASSGSWDCHGAPCKDCDVEIGSAFPAAAAAEPHAGKCNGAKATQQPCKDCA